MWFRKSATKKDIYPFPGSPVTIHGIDAVKRTEALAGAVVAPGLMQASGYAIEGLRSAAIVDRLSGETRALYDAAGKRLSYVVNLTCRAQSRQSGALHGGHEDYYAGANTGCFQMFAKNAQEVSDFTLIAHRIAERTLTPGVCAQDLYATSHGLRPVLLPDPRLVEAYLGRCDDRIDPPSPAQEILFGGPRRRVPVLLDIDRPAGIGGNQDGESYFRSVAAQSMFFAAPIASVVDEAMNEFGELTGRHYGPALGYRCDDADFLVVAQGSIVDELEAVVDYLRGVNIRAGVVNVSVLRPFPGAVISELLKGKKVVTVLDRSDQPLAADGFLATEIRVAVDRAVENAGASNGNLPNPDYERYDRNGDRPRIVSGVYGDGGEAPRFRDLVAVYRNMAAARIKTRFYVGFHAGEPQRRFPHLQALQQKLNRTHPDLDARTLESSQDDVMPKFASDAVEIHSVSAQGGIFAANLFAEALGASEDIGTRTYPEGGLESNLQPVRFTMAFDRDGEHRVGKPESANTILIANDALLDNLPDMSELADGARLIVVSGLAPEDLWMRIDARTERWLRERRADVHLVALRPVAGPDDPGAAYVDQLIIWSLLGATLKSTFGMTDEAVASFTSVLRDRLSAMPELDNVAVDGVVESLQHGITAVSGVSWETIDENRERAVEPDAPWTIEHLSRGDGSVFDVNRFWHSVGYFYERGRQVDTLTDPHLATGVMAARSSAFRDVSSYRIRLPRWIPENCTACGLCWTACPETSMPVTVQSISSVVETAMHACEERGATMVQLGRVKDHLCKQAYTIFRRDGLNQYRGMDALLSDAFDQLVTKMKLEGEKLDALKAEFDPIREQVAGFPMSRTEAFFDDVESTVKGSGEIFSLAINPLSCTACGLCVEVCPDDALEWVDQAPAIQAEHRRNWEFLLSLPDVTEETIDAHIDASDPETERRRLLRRAAYHAIVGGDGSPPGSGGKIAAHLVAAASESVMAGRYASRVTKLSSLIAQMEQKIQGGVAETVAINDFEAFGQRLSALEDGNVTGDNLARLTGDGRDTKELDKRRLLRLNNLLLELVEQRKRYQSDASSGGRARMVAAVDPGSHFPQGTYPYNGHAYPWVVSLPGGALSLAEGIFGAMTTSIAKEFSVVRQVELELKDAYKSSSHDAFFAGFGWDDFSDEERGLAPLVMCFANASSGHWAGATAVVSRRYPIKTVLINEKVLDRVVADGDAELRDSVIDDVMALTATRGTAYLLQSGVGQPGHVIRGVRRGCSVDRPALFHIYAPDALGDGIAPEKVMEQARRASESRVFPSFTFDPENASLDGSGNPEATSDWAPQELTSVDPSGTTATVVSSMTPADWAVGQGRFTSMFDVVSRGSGSDVNKPLSEYLEMDAADREQFQPCIDIVGPDGRLMLARPHAKIVAATERCLARWRRLNAAFGVLAAAIPSSVGDSREMSDVNISPPAGTESASFQSEAYERLTERLLSLCGYRDDPEFFSRSLREFITKSDVEQTPD